MGDYPLVTIMIPTYGQAALIAEAVESALAQDYPNIEVVVADDCSPDATEAALAHLRGDPRLRYVRNAANLGRVGNYRHTLYDTARGAWCLNLDGDDYLTDPGFISAAMALAIRHPSVVLVVGNTIVSRHGQQSGYLMNAPLGSPLVMRGTTFLLEHAPFLSNIQIPHMSALYRRDVALATDFYRQQTLCADSESLYRIGIGHEVAFIDPVAGVWRQHGANASDAERTIKLDAIEQRAHGILQWARDSGAFMPVELARLERNLAVGCRVFAIHSLAAKRAIGAAARGIAGSVAREPDVGLRALAWFARYEPMSLVRRLWWRAAPATTASVRSGPKASHWRWMFATNVPRLPPAARRGATASRAA